MGELAGERNDLVVLLGRRKDHLFKVHRIGEVLQKIELSLRYRIRGGNNKACLIEKVVKRVLKA